MKTETTDLLYTTVKAHFLAHIGHRYDNWRLATRIGSTSGETRPIVDRLVSEGFITACRTGGHIEYFVPTEAERDLRDRPKQTFVVKPYVMPQALKDAQKRCEEARVIKSRGGD